MSVPHHCRGDAGLRFGGVLVPQAVAVTAVGLRRLRDGGEPDAIVAMWKAPSAGVRIGWIDAEFVYLNASICHKAIAALAKDMNQSLGTVRQVRVRLVETGRVIPEPPKRGDQEGLDEKSGRRFTRRVWAEKSQKEALWVPRQLLFPPMPLPPS
jgi:hypothetical protein